MDKFLLLPRGWCTYAPAQQPPPKSRHSMTFKGFRQICTRYISWGKHHIWNTRGYSHDSCCNSRTVPSIDTIRSSTIVAEVIGYLQLGLMDIYSTSSRRRTNKAQFRYIVHTKIGAPEQSGRDVTSIFFLIKIPPLTRNWPIHEKFVSLPDNGKKLSF